MALPRLLGCFMSARCDLRLDLTRWLRPLQFVPLRARSLALALGLWRALVASLSTDARKVTLKECLSSLVDFLIVPPSHSLVQVHLPTHVYDGVSTVERFLPP
jgi:hypothetical protein